MPAILCASMAAAGWGGEDLSDHPVPLPRFREWLREQENAGKAIDFKIHACLWLVGLTGGATGRRPASAGL